MIREDDNRAAAEETARMVREEVVLRPARRAAAFFAIVVLGLTGTAFASTSGGDGPGSGFEIRAEISSAQHADASPN
ncbi:MAG: hypothetical protein ACRDLO_10280 [Solirubrobacterales bacterium]